MVYVLVSYMCVHACTCLNFCFCYQVYFGMLDALLASEELPEEYRDRCQVKQPVLVFLQILWLTYQVIIISGILKITDFGILGYTVQRL